MSMINKRIHLTWDAGKIQLGPKDALNPYTGKRMIADVNALQDVVARVDGALAKLLIQNKAHKWRHNNK